MPKPVQFAAISVACLVIAGCDRSEKLPAVAANSGMEVTHGEGAAGGEGYGLSNQAAELPDNGASTANSSQ